MCSKHKEDDEMLQTTHKGLSGTALKTIALVLMLMDHIHYFFEFTGCIPEWFSMLACLSAPLFGRLCPYA